MTGDGLILKNENKCAVDESQLRLQETVRTLFQGVKKRGMAELLILAAKEICRILSGEIAGVEFFFGGIGSGRKYFYTDGRLHRALLSESMPDFLREDEELPEERSLSRGKEDERMFVPIHLADTVFGGITVLFKGNALPGSPGEKGKLEIVACILENALERRALGIRLWRERREQKKLRIRWERECQEFVWNGADLHQAAEVIRRRRDRLEVVVRHMADLICLHSLEGRIEYVSPSVGRILGYSTWEIIGRTMESLVHPHDRKLFFRQYQVENAGVPEEYRLLRQDGDYVWMEAVAVPIDGADEGERCWQVCARDITQRREAEANVRRRARVIELTHEGVFITDHEGKIELWNRSMERITGIDPETAVGKNIAELLGISGGRVMSAIRNLPVAGSYELEVDSFPGGEEVVSAYILLSRLQDEARGREGIIGYVLDVSRLRRAEAQLRKINHERRRNRFLNDLIHGDVLSAQNAGNRQSAYGLDCMVPYLLCMAKIDCLSRENDENSEEEEILLLECLDFLSEKNWISWEYRQGIVVLQHIPAGTICDSEFMQNCGMKVKQALQEVIKKQSVTVGVGSLCHQILDLPQGYRQAEEAVEVGRRIWGGNGVYCYENLGLYQLLFHMQDKKQLQSFVRRMIGPLLEYDQKNKSQLVQTLERILTGNSLVTLAKEMNLHHKTLLFRKQRIEDILRISLTDQEKRLTLLAALRLHRMTPMEIDE